jgi:hypothetical protein
MGLIWATIISVLGLVGTIIIAVAGRLMSDDLKEWLPWITRQLIERAVRRLPENERERRREEWESDVDEWPGNLAKLYRAWGYLSAARTVRSIAVSDATPQADRMRATIDFTNDLLERQLEAVKHQRVRFFASRIMRRSEYELFRAALGVTRQPMPTGAFPFYVFPQVSLGQIIGTEGEGNPEADEAYRAINSKRCDLLITDRSGTPIAVLEYQGAGHDIGSTARRRNNIKRIALERAGVRYIEIPDGTSLADTQRIIRQLLAPPT